MTKIAKKLKLRPLMTVFAMMALPATSQAGPIMHDANVTPDVIFGSGNDNGAFTVHQMDNVELGLRAKQRFPADNIFNSNGDGTYTFRAGLPEGGGFGFADGSTSTAIWNFEWSINSDFDGGSGNSLSDLTYELSIDFDPGPGTNFLSFDPIDVSFADHAIGDNSTGNGMGTVASDSGEYSTLISENNVAQNSWNMEFFDDASAGFAFDGRVPGSYEFMLTASDSTGVLASTSITVNSVVPEPTSMALFGLGAVCLCGYGYRRKQKSSLSES